MAVVVATFLPWVNSGSRSRSSYGLLGVIDRLGIAGEGLAGTAIRWWPVVPLLVTAAVLLGCWHRHRLAVIVALVTTVYVVGVAAVLIAVRTDADVDLGIGVWLGAATGLLFSVAAVVAVLKAASDPDR